MRVAHEGHPTPCWLIDWPWGVRACQSRMERRVGEAVAEERSRNESQLRSLRAALAASVGGDTVDSLQRVLWHPDMHASPTHSLSCPGSTAAACISPSPWLRLRTLRRT